MGAERKKKSRVGLGIYRINRNELGRRSVLQVFCKQPVITHAYFDKLTDDIYHEAKELQKSAKASMEFSLPEIEYDMEIVNENDGMIFNISDSEYSESKSALRIVVGSEDINVNPEEAKGLVNIANITAVKDRITPVFDNTSKYPETIRAKLHVSDAIKYSKYFFMDIVMANSSPIAPAIRKYTSLKGHEELFKLKVNFASKHYSGTTCFGKTYGNESYLNFASLCEVNGEFDYNKYIDVWDQFIIKELDKYTLSRDGIFKYLNSCRGHENQVSKSSLYRLLDRLENGPNVIVLPCERPNTTEHFEEAMSKYGFSTNCQKNWHREIGATNWNLYKQIETHLVDNKILEPFKIILGG